MRRLLGMACARPVAFGFALALAPILPVLWGPATPAFAGPETPVDAATPGSLTRYRARLESEAAQVFEESVTDSLRRPLAAKGVALWATQSVTAWSKVVTEAAPSLAPVVEALGQRSRVLWREERVIDAYDTLILQLATVHAMQRGLFRIVDGVGKPATPSADPAPLALAAPAPIRSPAPIWAPAPIMAPAPVTAPAPYAEPAPRAPLIPDTLLPAPRTTAPNAYAGSVRPTTPAPAAAEGRPVPMSATPLPHPTAAPISAGMPPMPMEAPPPSPRLEGRMTRGFKPTGRGPVWPPTLTAPSHLREYQGALDREAYRILSPEIEGGMQDALAARKSSMRGAPTVAAWKAELAAASPTLGKAGAVLERRTEVLRGETRVVDTMESDAVQRAAVGGLQAGLERILAQFGR